MDQDLSRNCFISAWSENLQTYTALKSISFIEGSKKTLSLKFLNIVSQNLKVLSGAAKSTEKRKQLMLTDHRFSLNEVKDSSVLIRLIFWLFR